MVDLVLKIRRAGRRRPIKVTIFHCAMAVGCLLLVEQFAPQSFALGTLYLPVVVYAGSSGNLRALALVTTGCVAAITFGYALSSPDDFWSVYGLNYLVSAIIVLATDLAMRIIVSAENERVKLSKSARRSELLHRLTIELRHEVVVTASPDGRVTSVSPTWEELTGLSCATLLGNGLVEHIHPDDRGSSIFPSLTPAAPDEPVQKTLRLLSKEGEYRWWQMRFTPLLSEANRILEWFGTLEDVDNAQRVRLRLHQAEAEMAHLSRNHAAGTMASTLAHELNQPLTAAGSYISGAVRLIRSGKVDAAEVESAIVSAGSNIMRAGNIIRSLREMVEYRPVTRKQHALSDLFASVLSLSTIGAQLDGTTVTSYVSDDAQCVYGDRIQIEQVLFNLLRNAIEAVRDRSERRIVMSSAANDGMCAIRVADTGCGIDQQILANLFKPFNSNKSDGMGIGLSISRTIIEAHGGRIQVESLDPGTAFTVVLPHSPSKQSPSTNHSQG